MGELIFLDQRRRALRARPRSRGPALIATQAGFYFDLACPFSYLAAERVERVLGDAHWIPVSAAALGDGSSPDDLRVRAQERAQRLRLPLVWPERFPAQTPRALRAAVHAGELGAGARFALAGSRLAFCGGFDLDDPEALAEAAAAAGVPLEDCLSAAGDPARDRPLLAAARHLRARGVRQLPALSLGPQIVQGEAAVFAALGLVPEGGMARDARFARVGGRARPMVPAR